MPIYKMPNDKYQWGKHGAQYPTREGAVKQAAAAHASGYVSKDKNPTPPKGGVLSPAIKASSKKKPKAKSKEKCKEKNC